MLHQNFSTSSLLCFLIKKPPLWVVKYLVLRNDYFLAYFFLNLSIRPAVSTNTF